MVSSAQGFKGLGFQGFRVSGVAALNPKPQTLNPHGQDRLACAIIEQAVHFRFLRGCPQKHRR